MMVDRIVSGYGRLIYGVVGRRERVALEALGFSFNPRPLQGESAGYAMFPEGWRVAQGGSYDSYPVLLDPRGRPRTHIEKVDRMPYLRVNGFFRTYLYYDGAGPERRSVKAVIAGGSGGIVCTFREYYYEGTWDSLGQQHKNAKESALAEVNRWLDIHHPRWRDPTYGWED